MTIEQLMKSPGWILLVFIGAIGASLIPVTIMGTLKYAEIQYNIQDNTEGVATLEKYHPDTRVSDKR